MSEKSKQKIVIIGCGAVAMHLARRFKHDELYVYNHKAHSNLSIFRNELRAQTFTNLKAIITDADLYFVCIKDEFITDVLNAISYLPPSSLVGITSGNYNLKDYKGKLKGLAIMYPLQTFSAEDEIKWKDVTIVVDALQKTVASRASKAARILSEDVVVMTYEQRLKLHLAAVVANNFTNSLYVEADKILKSIGSEFSLRLLYPLLKQGIKKLKYISPLEAQTGPAKRNDKQVMAKHEELLKNEPELKQLYKILSNLIISQQKAKK